MGDPTDTEPEFYEKAKQYWSTVPSTINGMLGGLGYIHTIDIQGSSSFLWHLRKITTARALDCGAGIGRVTKHLLMPRFVMVDMVEQDPAFAQKARDYCTSGAGDTLGFSSRLGEIYNTGLQQFCPIQGKYNLIWSQWVLGHLTDSDLVAFFRRIRQGLAENGFFVMKENVSSTQDTEMDDNDSSVTRPLKTYERFLKQADLRIFRVQRQQNFPKGLYPVFMIACHAASDKL